MKINKNVITKIIDHARRDAPLEACGYLAGKGDLVTRHYELANIDKSPEHFSFEPKEQFQVVRQARADGLEILAVYHSHPVSGARPSAEDIKLAYDERLSYVIVSLAEGSGDIRSFRVKGSNVKEEPLEVVDDRV